VDAKNVPGRVSQRKRKIELTHIYRRDVENLFRAFAPYQELHSISYQCKMPMIITNTHKTIRVSSISFFISLLLGVVSAVSQDI
jgi:chloramphenicol O-acetyltransferase